MDFFYKLIAQEILKSWGIFNIFKNSQGLFGVKKYFLSDFVQDFFYFVLCTNDTMPSTKLS